MSQLWFGGSFNPIHHGHLICARAVAESMGLDRVVLVPSRQPPHKQTSAAIAPAADRLAMCRLAIADSPLFEIDDLELHRTGPSYTIDTVRELKRRGDSQINWLIGADMLNILPSWHQAENLLTETRFIIMARPGWNMDWHTLPPAYRALQSQVVIAPRIEIGATDIRNRVATGRSVEHLTPPAVVRYILETRLYSAA
jgi:nicotinate-nucleotide adenylyltransferase